MKIKSRVSFKEYRKLLFGLTYKKPMMKVIVCIALAMLVWISGYYLHFLPVPKPEIYQYITLIVITVVQPVVIYWTIKRNYDSSNHLRELLEIELTQDEIKIPRHSTGRPEKNSFGNSKKFQFIKKEMNKYQNTITINFKASL